MIKKDLLAADSFIVVNKKILEDSSHKLLTLIYQPLIGYEAVSLYLNLWSLLDQQDIISDNFLHNHLFKSMNINKEVFVEARRELEALGLLKTYFKDGNPNNYLYELYPPLEAFEFLNNPLLSMSLYSKVGEKEYKRIIDLFKVPKVSLTDYENITTEFSELYKTVPNITETNDGLKDKLKNSLELNMEFDFEVLKTSLPQNVDPNKIFTENNIELIKNLAFIYNLDELKFKELLISSITSDSILDKKLLKKNARNYYSLEEGAYPKLVNRAQPDTVKKENKDNSKRDKMINFFETVTPYNFLKYRNNNRNPSKRDLSIVEELVVNMKLNPGVVNVLLDYIFRINNNKLTQNFVLTIAGQWQRANIKTVEEAMNLAEKEYKEYKSKPKKTFVKQKEDKLPEWFDEEEMLKEIDENEKEKLDTLLKEFK